MSSPLRGGPRADRPRELRLAAPTATLSRRASDWTSNVRVRYFTPGEAPPPLAPPLVLLAEFGRIGRRPAGELRAELDAHTFHDSSEDMFAKAAAARA